MSERANVSNTLQEVFRMGAMANNNMPLKRMLMFDSMSNAIGYFKDGPGPDKAAPGTCRDHARGLTVSLEEVGRGCPAQG